MCMQGDGLKAEQYLKRALHEAKAGFGNEDAHVASAQNNLAELYRVIGEYDKAEVLYDEVRPRSEQSYFCSVQGVQQQTALVRSLL